MTSMLYDCLKLIRTKNIGVSRFFELISHYQTPTRALKELPKLAQNKKLSFSFEYPTESSLEKEIEATHQAGAVFISYFDEHYPEALKHIPDPPPILIAKGNIDLLSQPKIALIGSRNASLNGQTYTAKIAKELGENGYVTVSGLARGIDSAAHKASIETGTIGVIAGGIDHIYPYENRALFHDLYEKGLVLTEMPFGSTAKAQDFPRRNRIVAGLSLGVVVIEAALRSGSLITARLANEYGRDIFSVPGSPLDPRAEGTNKLIQNGAKLIQSTQDIIEDLTPYTKPTAAHQEQNKFDFDTDSVPAEPKSESRVSDGSLDNEILNALDKTPIETDLVIRKIHANNNTVDTAQCLQAIQKLELLGSITRHSGNKISRS